MGHVPAIAEAVVHSVIALRWAVSVAHMSIIAIWWWLPGSSTRLYTSKGACKFLIFCPRLLPIQPARCVVFCFSFGHCLVFFFQLDYSV